MDAQPQSPQDLDEDFRKDDESQNYSDESSVYSDGRVVDISEFGDDTQEYDESVQDYDDESQDIDENYVDESQDVDENYDENSQDYDDSFDDAAQNYDGYEDENSYSDEQTNLADEFYDDEVEETIIYSKEVVDKWHKRCIRVLIFPIIFSSIILLSFFINTTTCFDSCGNTNIFTLFLIWMLYRPTLAIIPISALVCSLVAFSYNRRKELVGDGRAGKRIALLILSLGWLAPALFVLFAIVGP